MCAKRRPWRWSRRKGRSNPTSPINLRERLADYLPLPPIIAVFPSAWYCYWAPMPPEITDALIARAILTRRMIEAGQDYWAQGRVRDLTVAAGRGVARAVVRGSRPSPYEVSLHFEGAGRATPVTTCSCPVESGCKYAAAVLFALRAGLHDAAGSSGVARTPLPAPLPPALSQWMTAMQPLLRVTHPAAGRPERALCYVVRAQAMVGNSRSSARRLPASLALPGAPLRLFTEIVDTALDPEGEPTGAASKVHAYHFSTGATLPHLAAEDRLIGRRLQTRLGDTDHENCLAGAGGSELLRRMIESGRARFGSARGSRLRIDEPLVLGFDWRHDASGAAVLTIATGDRPGFVAVGAPPFLVDPASGSVRQIETGVSADLAEQLLRMPPVPIEAMQTVAERWDEIAPPGVPPPVGLDIHDLGRVSPVPVLTLMLDRVRIEEPGDWRWYRRKTATQTALARLTFDYGVAMIGPTAADARVLVRDERGLTRFDRHLAAEAAARDRLGDLRLYPLDMVEDVSAAARQAWDHAPLVPAEPEDLATFLLMDAPALRKDGWRAETAPDFPLRLVAAESGSLSATVSPSGIDWFDVALGVTVDGERIDLVPALRRLLGVTDPGAVQALLAEGNVPDALLPVSLGDGRIVTIEAARVVPMLRALLVLATNDVLSGASGRSGFARHDLGVLADLVDTTPDLAWQGGEALRALAASLSELHFAPTPVPESFRATLRPYQQTGLDWLGALGRAQLGGLLADDMGLGKTIQTLAHIAVLKAQGALGHPVLIVCPTSVLPNWQAEAARFAPDLSLLVLHGAKRHDRYAEIAGHDVALTSYPLLIRDRQTLANQRFALAVFDEAHNLKNPRTAGHQAAKALGTDRRLALTGTPVENRLADAWALFDLLVPGLLADYKSFRRNVAGPIEERGDRAARAHLARKLRPFLLRRTKEAVATELPPKSTVPLTITPAPAQMALHESQRLLMQERVRGEIARVGLMRAQIVVLTALTRLRQICCDLRLIDRDGAKPAPSAKLDRLIELLDELIPEGRRIIVFSQFTSMLDLIKPELDARGIAWTQITGITRDRVTPVTRFQAGEVPVILISLKAGGTGLNLTAADTVILYDPWWNPAIEAQAIDRAHRIGQSKPVFVYRMVMAGTIEEKILHLQERKAALADALWSEDPATPARLGEDDIAFLLG